ncbi:MAG: hypothetical protein WBX03_18235 [Terriglobales bacterium]|jgi:hypothetical protein
MASVVQTTSLPTPPGRICVLPSDVWLYSGLVVIDITGGGDSVGTTLANPTAVIDDHGPPLLTPFMSS